MRLVCVLRSRILSGVPVQVLELDLRSTCSSVRSLEFGSVSSAPVARILAELDRVSLEGSHAGLYLLPCQDAAVCIILLVWAVRA